MCPPAPRVCVLYDRASEFATGAFAALRDSAAEAGWTVDRLRGRRLPRRARAARLGRRDRADARSRRAPDRSPRSGAAGERPLITGGADPERDALIAQYAQTTDVYEAREILAQIEATIVQCRASPCRSLSTRW